MNGTGRRRHSSAAWARSLLLAGLLLDMPSAWADAASSAADVLDRQAEQYAADAPKTVMELQQFRRSESIAIGGAGGRRGTATLVELNPRINSWLLLTLEWGSEGERVTYHLENPNPAGESIRLADANPRGVQISFAASSVPCDLWSGGIASPLEQARRSRLPYAPLCDNRLYLRNRVVGSATTLERTTDFLRDHVWGGETIVRFVRNEFFQDRFIDRGVPGSGAAPAAPAVAPPDGPRAAVVNEARGDHAVVPDQLGIDLGRPVGELLAGRWYPVDFLAGAYGSFLAPRMITPEILGSYRKTVNDLDPVEADALVYLVAFDLGEFDVGFALGTDHPRVGWSQRALDGVRDSRLPGPDGIDTIAPLVGNGMISPALASRAVATFTGGFKRQHGAFHYGPLAGENHGHHYGFVQDGAVLSKLMPGLATLYVLDDGSVAMKTWTGLDDQLLSRVKHARQNGVPLIEHDATADVSAPGSLVARWGPGNWSGSADEKLRTVRAGACLQETASGRYLIYGYFSSATPSAMARVFQAYGCRYAMHLDMNALEHTYLALYVHKGASVVVEHLMQGMAEVDKKAGAEMLARFLGFPDDRDFFYLVHREKPI